MIEFESVHFSRGMRPILRGVSFAAGFEERIAILGGSGEGKTTMLRLIMGLLKPDEGRILIDGEDIGLLSQDSLRNVRLKFGIVFQEGALFDSLSVRENVAFYLREYTKMSEEQIEKRVSELLRVVGVNDALELMPEELSGGMQRRVAIARSLAAQEPRMVLYDEPTSDLDPVNAELIRNLILDLSRTGRGFIVVTHEIFDALELAQRFMFLREGRLRFDGSKEGLLTSDDPDINAFLGPWHALTEATR